MFRRRESSRKGGYCPTVGRLVGNLSLHRLYLSRLLAIGPYLLVIRSPAIATRIGGRYIQKSFANKNLDGSLFIDRQKATMNLRSSTFIRLLSVIGLFTSPALAQVYKLVDLGDVRPQRINESNQVVGLTWYGGDAYNSYVWQNGSATGIGALNAGGSTVANGINEAGKVVGYSWLASGPRHAFLWEHGAMT